jgi:hypothetical protein
MLGGFYFDTGTCRFEAHSGGMFWINRGRVMNRISEKGGLAIFRIHEGSYQDFNQFVGRVLATILPELIRNEGIVTDQVPQNFDNHPFLPKPWLFTALLILAGTLTATAGLLMLGSAVGPYLIGGGVVLNGSGGLLGLALLRGYAVNLQDRIIRTEMRARLEGLLPTEDLGRIQNLTIKQMVGMRFASDSEMPELFRKVLDDDIQDATPIKKMVKDWQGDYHRV